MPAFNGSRLHLLVIFVASVHLLSKVAVAQTPGGLTEAFLRVGSKKPQVVVCPQRALLGLGAAGPLSDRRSERGPGSRRWLCATAS